MDDSKSLPHLGASPINGKCLQLIITIHQGPGFYLLRVGEIPKLFLCTNTPVAAARMSTIHLSQQTHEGLQSHTRHPKLSGWCGGFLGPLPWLIPRTAC